MRLATRCPEGVHFVPSEDEQELLCTLLLKAIVDKHQEQYYPCDAWENLQDLLEENGFCDLFDGRAIRKAKGVHCAYCPVEGPTHKVHPDAR